MSNPQLDYLSAGRVRERAQINSIEVIKWLQCCFSPECIVTESVDNVSLCTIVCSAHCHLSLFGWGSLGR